MKIRRYNQFMNELAKTNILPTYDEIEYALQAVIDEADEVRIKHIYIGDNSPSTVTTSVTPDNAASSFKFMRNVRLDGYSIYVLNSSPLYDIITEVNHCFENLKIDYPDVLCKFVVHDATNLKIHITYNEKTIYDLW